MKRFQDQISPPGGPNVYLYFPICLNIHVLCCAINCEFHFSRTEKIIVLSFDWRNKAWFSNILPINKAVKEGGRYYDNDDHPKDL